MITVEEPEVRQELAALCASVKEFVMRQEYSAAEEMISQAMAKYPHEPEPHNLLGLVLEAQGDHVTAMKHFRASWTMNPAYRPAQHNLDLFGSFFVNGKWAFDESDCVKEKSNDAYVIEYDAAGIGRVVKKEL